MRLQLGEAVRAAIDVCAIFQAIAQNDVHHAEGECSVGSRMDDEMLVGERCSPRLVWVDDDQPCTVPTGLFNEGPEVNIVAVNVRAPRDDEAGICEVFRRSAKANTVDAGQRRSTSRSADGAVELRSSQPMKKTAVHRGVAQLADGSGVAVGQDALGAMLVGDLLEPRSDLVQRLVPGDAFEGLGLAALWQRSFWNACLAAHGIEQAIGRVDAVEILRHLAAEKAARDRVRGIALHLDGASGQLVDGDENAA